MTTRRYTRVVWWAGLFILAALSMLGIWYQPRLARVPFKVLPTADGPMIIEYLSEASLPEDWPDPQDDLLVTAVGGIQVVRSWHIPLTLTGRAVGDHVQIAVRPRSRDRPAAASVHDIELVGGGLELGTGLRAFICLLLLLSAGLLLYHSSGHRATISLAAILALVAATVALEETGSWLGSGLLRYGTGIIWSYIYGFVAPAMVAFASTFLSQSTFWERFIWFRPLTWTVGVGTGTCIAVGPIIYLANGSRLGIQISAVGRYAYWISLIWGAVILGLSLFLAYRQARDWEMRSRIFWVQMSYLLGALPTLAFFLIPRLFDLPSPLEESTYFLFLLLVPICLLIGVVRHRFLDINLSVRQGFMYAPVTALVYMVFGSAFVLVGYLLLRAVSGELPRLHLGMVAVLALLAVLYHLLYEPLRHRVQSRIDRTFFRTKYRYGRSVREFSEALDEKVESPGILNHLIQTVRGILNPSWLEVVDVTGSWQGRWGRVRPAKQPRWPHISIPFRGLDGLELWLGPKRSGMAYHSYDWALLGALVNLVGTRLQREEMQRLLLAEAAEKELLIKEMEMARQIQEHLLPEAPPALEGYLLAGSNIPCLTIGGDYFDYIPLPDGRWLITIGDVVGHGVSAALLMANLHACLRGHIQHELELRGMLGKVNEFIHAATDVNHYITLFCGILDPSTGEFTYVNAGHPSPMKTIEGSRDGLELLHEGGIPLGMMPDVAYDSGATVFGPGEVLFMYTDGVTEAEDPHQELLGEEAIEECLRLSGPESPEELIGRVLLRLEEHRQDREQEDDITIVVLKCTGTGGAGPAV